MATARSVAVEGIHRSLPAIRGAKPALPRTLNRCVPVALPAAPSPPSISVLLAQDRRQRTPLAWPEAASSARGRSRSSPVVLLVTPCRPSSPGSRARYESHRRLRPLLRRERRRPPPPPAILRPPPHEPRRLLGNPREIPRLLVLPFLPLEHRSTAALLQCFGRRH